MTHVLVVGTSLFGCTARQLFFSTDATLWGVCEW